MRSELPTAGVHFQICRDDTLRRVRRVGAGRAHINNLEAGRRASSLALVLRMVECFGVTTDYLLRDTIPVEQVEVIVNPMVAGPEPPPRLLGSKLRYLRMQRHLTQADVATLLKLAANAHVSFLEADKKEPLPDLVVQLADLFRVTTDYLLRDAIPAEMAGGDPGK